MIKSKTSLQTPIYLLQCFLSHLINRDNLFLPSSTSLHPPPIYFIPSPSPKLCRAPHSDSNPSRFISSRSPRESEVKLTEFRVYNFIYLDKVFHKELDIKCVISKEFYTMYLEPFSGDVINKNLVKIIQIVESNVFSSSFEFVHLP